MNKVVKILMERDELTEQEAQDMLEEARQAIKESNYDPEEVESIFYDFLGLELDYLFDVI